MNRPLHNTTVMVVDDNVETCDLLRFALEQHGASVIVSQTMDAALKTFRQSPPHAVVADIRLGESDGCELIQAIREYNREYRGFTAAIAVTGFASPEDRARAMAAGFDAYLTKPFDPAKVVSEITRIISGPENLAA